jgi:predicted DNA-binding protein
MEKDLRINVRADEALKEELREVIEKTGLTEAVIVREGVKEKLRSLKNTHPAYASTATSVEVTA